MSPLDLDRVTAFVNDNIDEFHRARLARIQELQLRDVLKRKNPYLFKAKNLNTALEIVDSILEAWLSSSEEGLFGHFLEELAIFVNMLTYEGQKSSSPGIDLEFSRDGIRYLVAIKSGPNWGNKSQHDALRANFKTALKILRQSQQVGEVRAVLGTCYGKSRTADNGEYLKISGQSFWDFISGERNVYIDIVEPIGNEAERHNALYQLEKIEAQRRLVADFIQEFCDETQQINWVKLVKFNSGNM